MWANGLQVKISNGTPEHPDPTVCSTAYQGISLLPLLALLLTRGSPCSHYLLYCFPGDLPAPTACFTAYQGISLLPLLALLLSRGSPCSHCLLYCFPGDLPAPTACSTAFQGISLLPLLALLLSRGSPCSHCLLYCFPGDLPPWGYPMFRDIGSCINTFNGPSFIPSLLYSTFVLRSRWLFVLGSFCNRLTSLASVM